MSLPEPVEAIGATLAAVAQLVHSNWEEISEHYIVAQIAAEAAGLLDIVTGNHVTNPEQRADLHLQALNRLVNDLSSLGGNGDSS